MPFKYRIGGVTLTSDLRLPGKQARFVDESLTWRMNSIAKVSQSTICNRWRPLGYDAKGKPTYSIYWDYPDKLALRFHGLADFYVGYKSKTIKWLSAPGTPEGVIRYLFLDQLLPRLLSAAGKSVLHGGAVAIDSGAIAFVGPSGSGKSTLIASMGRHANAIADDSVVIEVVDGSPKIIPNFAGVRLYPDSLSFLDISNQADIYSPKEGLKTRVIMRNQDYLESTQYIQLKAITLLAPKPCSHAPTMRPIVGHRALMEIVKNSYTVVGTRKEVLEHTLKSFRTICETVPLFELVYSHEYDALSELGDYILSIV